MGRIVINTQKETAPLGDMFGIFFEDLNHAADGGLYGELVRNRSFEFSSVDNEKYDNLTAWEFWEKGDSRITAAILEEMPVSEKNPHYLKLEVTKGDGRAALVNTGFGTGIPIKEKESYYFSCYAKTEGKGAYVLKAALTDEDGSIVYAEKEFKITGTDWKQYSFALKAAETDHSGRLMLEFEKSGVIYLDFISLFPKHTFMDRKNGLRADIAQMLKELRPKFMRFPGGCLVHDGQLDPKARDSMYRWKNTIGPLTERAARRNNWGYNQTLGLGYYEYFQFCEDIGAKPLPVLPAAYDPHHRRMAPIGDLSPWIQDALDLIEFANGSVDTKWGGIRSALGHPDSFGLEYIGIGNEEVGDGFVERYPYFHKAIKEKHPEIKIIATSGPFAAGSEYKKGWQCAKENQADLVDEHYYQSPEWFLGNMHRYDDFPAAGPKVFLGEFASWGNTWYNALTEAAYMTQLQNNAHAVGLVCYAPLLCHTDYVNWKPDMIWFNNHDVYGTPNYYVQQLFMHHQGDILLERSLEALGENQVMPVDISGALRVFAINNSVKYSNIQIENQEDGTAIRLPDIQLSGKEESSSVLSVASRHYIITMDAEELEGKNGFLLTFGQKDEKNKYTWELGGWQNLDSMLSEIKSGRSSCLTQSEFSVEPGRTYHLKLVVKDAHIQGYVNGILLNETIVKPVVLEPLYVTASVEKCSGDIILKVVNLQKEDVTAEVDLTDKKAAIHEGKIYYMGGFGLEAQNSFAAPRQVAPAVEMKKIDGNLFQYTFPKESLTVMRLK